MKIKKMTALLMTAAMTVSLAACGGSGQSTGTASGTEGAGSTEGSAQADDSGNVELTYMHKLNGTEKYVGSDDINNNVYTRCYQDELGITLKYTIAAAGDDYTQKLTMAIASNDLPDLMDLPPEEFSELANAGMLADITEAYDTYASDLLKETIEVDGGVQLASAKVDGKLYGLPQLSAADGTCVSYGSVPTGWITWDLRRPPRWMSFLKWQEHSVMTIRTETVRMIPGESASRRIS